MNEEKNCTSEVGNIYDFLTEYPEEMFPYSLGSFKSVKYGGKRCDFTMNLLGQ